VSENHIAFHMPAIKFINSAVSSIIKKHTIIIQNTIQPIQDRKDNFLVYSEWWKKTLHFLQIRMTENGVIKISICRKWS
jgi:hypothetical protein